VAAWLHFPCRWRFNPSPDCHSYYRGYLELRHGQSQAQALGKIEIFRNINDGFVSQEAMMKLFRHSLLATERILLRKVGGGYIFIHRLLLDYFASLDNASNSD